MLTALVVTGIAQASSEREIAPVDIATPNVSTTHGETSVTTTLPESFTYRVGVLSGVTTDNFWAFYGAEPSVWNSYVLGPTKPALYTADPDGAGLIPELARSQVDPEQDEQGWFVTIEIDSDHEWSDGHPVTPKDLVFTFDTVRSLSLGGSWSNVFPETVTSVEIVGEDLVEIRFSDRPQLSAWPHGVGTAPWMPEHVWSEVAVETAEDLYAQAGSHDVSGGPLAITERSEDLILSVRNPGYPGGDTPDSVEYHVFPDEDAAVAALIAGKIDYVLSPKGLSAEQVRNIEDSPGIEVVTNPGNAIRYLGFNLERVPMSDQAFRAALATLLDREELAGAVTPTVNPAYSILPAANQMWFDSEAADALRADGDDSLGTRLQVVVEMLESAGYAWESAPTVTSEGELSHGHGLTREGEEVAPVTILTPGDSYDPARPEYGAAVANALAVLGFEVQAVETDFDTVVERAFTPDDHGGLQYDMYLLGWTLGDPGLPGFYEALFSADGAMNNTGYSSEDFEDAHRAYQEAFTLDEARQALWEMETVLAADVPYLPLYTSPVVEAYRSDSVSFDVEASLGGLQARLGSIGVVQPAD